MLITATMLYPAVIVMENIMCKYRTRSVSNELNMVDAERF